MVWLEVLKEGQFTVTVVVTELKDYATILDVVVCRYITVGCGRVG